ncbi:alpha-L RNA-binding motif-containing protein [Xylariaceae sp. FL0804]|nr:alpha-L RNA-binding motif-containing protein [Xylariaceae sp. FL0804]
MKTRGLHNLRRQKLRMSWNKYNLFNFARMRDPRIGLNRPETFFQQKWRAKALMRTYHGEHVREGKWERMFSRRLLGVAEMDAQKMASNDGSEQAAGRGSGRQKIPPGHRLNRDGAAEVPPFTPYMLMAFAPLERRLDIAIFRAMFASSARQARQFCVHGAVKVNGKKMPYPAYLLNPGDMFQVDPDRVMYAAGAKKPQVPAGAQRARRSTDDDTDTAAATDPEAEAEAKAEPAVEEKRERKEPQVPQDPDTTDAPESVQINMKPTRRQIQDVVAQAKAIIKESQDPLSVTQKRKLREFMQQAKKLMSATASGRKSADEITDELASLVKEVNMSPSSSGAASSEAAAESSSSPSKADAPFDGLSRDEMRQLRERMEEHIRVEAENPRDASKPYVTPWRPRNYLAPFAFIPRYLEVNQNVCSAVYLRHPVARVGHAEVPTPYNYRTAQLAFNWYLRRR